MLEVRGLELATLEDLVRHPALRLLEVVVQDEYTHDVVVAHQDVFLVFDST